MCRPRAEALAASKAPRDLYPTPAYEAGEVRPIKPANILASLPLPTTGEAFEQILHCRNLRIERIVSSPEPETTRYDQDQDEWILLMQGAASLEIAGDRVELGAGDYWFIPAHTPHRVLATSAEPRCVWLAVHLDPSDVQAE
ncbi:MAG: cupin domain-containing protein [Thiohalocapsa sp. PB-PSB1]|jgi:cupin 2 domain-containing protein|nr:MAG: cupin domain-containing protein [Thiohalocapsa sp. PB-PSB1]HCS90172.1 cupin [Chromatiaceae bacterium]